jgi:hypothetical protein
VTIIVYQDVINIKKLGQVGNTSILCMEYKVDVLHCTTRVHLNKSIYSMNPMYLMFIA